MKISFAPFFVKPLAVEDSKLTPILFMLELSTLCSLAGFPDLDEMARCTGFNLEPRHIAVIEDSDKLSEGDLLPKLVLF